MKIRTLLLFLGLGIGSIHSQQQQSLECVQREFMVKVHIICDSLFFPEMFNVDVYTHFTKINTIWAPACIKFNVCEVVYDTNYNFRRWHIDTMEAEWLALHYEPRVINLYVVHQFLKPQGVAGYATLGGIALTNKPYIIANDKCLTWIHELGHFFGLEHTFEPPIGLSNNSDCATADNGLCDTPADPNGSYNDITCEYTDAVKDANGKFYKPLLENFMSYYGPCRKSFTHQQYEKMIQTYKTNPMAHF